MEKLVLQLIWSEEYYEQQQDNFTSTSQTVATRNSSHTEPAATTFDMDSLLCKRVKSITEHTLLTSFPFCFNQKFHPSVPAAVGKPCQWCQYKERIGDPSKGKVIPERRRHRTSGGNIVRVIKRCKRVYNNVFRCVICNIELCAPCFNEFHGIDLSTYHM